MPNSEEETSRHLAEAAREAEWHGAAFLRDLFLGTFRLELVHPYPDEPRARPRFKSFYDELEHFLRAKVDPVAIDERGEYPVEVIDDLTALGAFGMVIPEEYGGLGFTHREYARAMMLVGSHDANVAALLSAHQSIGVPRPLLLFGTEEQKQKYLPRCARGAISAFALTEPAVGSDPASIGTSAEPTPDGKFYILNGTKLWCTNGTIAELWSSWRERQQRIDSARSSSRRTTKGSRSRTDAASWGSRPSRTRSFRSATCGCRGRTSSGRKGAV